MRSPSSAPAGGADTARLPHRGSEHHLLLLHVVVVLTVVYLHNWLPTPKPTGADEAVFASGRAMSHLKDILDTGVRTVGSRANEAVTPHYLLAQVDKFKAKAAKGTEVEIDLQWPSGGFATSFLGGFVNTYGRVVNVVVRVSPTGTPEDAAALLVSAHFDSSMGTVGASDDCVNIAAMLEILRLVVREGVPAPIVFNFNGAEETNWQAAHGFITQHRWAKHLRAQVNLEASGAGGREIVIQNGPRNAWITRAYTGSVPYPHIHGVAQLIFESGVLPAQTDFQTYRDYHPVLKELPGMDFAVVQEGHVYHTAQDNLAHVDAAHVQRLGDNIHALIRSLAASPHLATPGALAAEADTTFDVLGLFVVSYSKASGTVLNLSALALLTFIALRTPYGRRQLPTRALDALRGAVLPAVGAGVAAPVAVAIVMTLLGRTISWYTNPWVAYALYVTPALAGIGACHVAYADALRGAAPKKDGQAQHAMEALVAACALLYAALLLPLALWNHTLVTFMVLVWFLPVLTRVAYEKFAHGALEPPLLFFATCVPGLVVWWHLFATTVGFFLPLTARIGNQAPPDVVVALISGLLISLTFVTPLTSLVFCSKQALTAAARLTAAAFGAAFLAALVFPAYTPERPKRLFIQHVHRTWHDSAGAVTQEDAGLWLNPMDYQGLDSLSKAWPAVAKASPRSNICSTKGADRYCDMPWFFPVSELLGGGRWLPASPPKVAKIGLTHRSTAQAGGGRRVEVTASGPTHITLILNQHRPQAKVVGWSFAKNLVAPRPDCNCHFVFHADGAPASIGSRADLEEHITNEGAKGLRYEYAPFKEPRVWRFWIDLDGDAPLDIAIYGHYLDAPLSAELRKEHAAIPEWADELAWSSTWSSYIL